MDQLEALSKKLGRLKGAAALFREARKEGIPVTAAQVKDYVAAVPQKQLLAQSQPSLGKSATSAIKEEGSRWQADLVCMTQFCLCCQQLGSQMRVRLLVLRLRC